jgi:isopentenyldiphosphate isomerase
MESLEIYDENDKKTGEIKSRDDVHKDGDWHHSVHVWIMNKKRELLIQRRSPRKISYPGMWDVISGGHILVGNSTTDTAVRELSEEIGLELAHKDLEYLFTIEKQTKTNNGTYIDHEFNDVFLVVSNINLSKLSFIDNEVTDAKFIPFKDLESMLKEDKDKFVQRPKEYEKVFKILHSRYNKK